MQVALIVGGLAVIFLGADWLVRGAGGLASRLGVPRFVVGLTVVSLGTSAPEIFVAADAALRGAGELVLGNVMGSNLANLGLILGITALIRPVAVDAIVVRRDLPVMLVVTLALFPVMAGGRVGRFEGVVLLALFFGYMALLLLPGIRNGTMRFRSRAVIADDTETDAPPQEESLVGLVALSVLGCGGLILGAEALVTGALDVARALGVSELVVGLTLVAVGTSIPELATSAMAAVRAETALALGNVVGSNIANLTLVLGSAALLRPFEASPGLITRELPVVLLLSVVALPLAWTELRLQRWEGGLLLGSYATLTLWLFLP